MRNAQGFSLIELLIVVVIIGIVAAIAIPNMIASRRAANEGSAVSTLRTLHSANITYAATSGNGDYAGLVSTQGTSAFTALSNLALIDSVLGSAAKSRYTFVGDRTAQSTGVVATFYFAANPTSPNSFMTGGNRRFGVATDGVIVFDSDPVDLGTPFDFITIAAAMPVAN